MFSCKKITFVEIVTKCAVVQWLNIRHTIESLCLDPHAVAKSV